MESSSRSKHIGLSNMSKKSDDVAKYYDNWAGDYNETLADWRYEAPEQVASMLRTKLSPKSTILDAGCGTGLSGRALHTAGFTTIDGIDVSHRSLEIAGTTGVYRNLHAMDLQQLPLPIPDDHYDGLACVGVLTYLNESFYLEYKCQHRGALRGPCRAAHDHVR
jgi:predicted TPR repeat methyltransferase